MAQVIGLGELKLTGTFAGLEDEKKIPRGDLTLVYCEECGLAQLDRNFPGELLYGSGYGYTSSLNGSMVQHLKQLATAAAHRVELAPGDVVLDIGSNDGTLLSVFSGQSLKLVGIDPIAEKFQSKYPPDATAVPAFFSANTFKEVSEKPAKLIFSISMFYDLENPQQFVVDIKESLARGGVWHFEQSYLLSMLEANAYDTICHEHIEYYSLRSIIRLLDTAGLDLVSVELNDTNGGSIGVTAALKGDYTLQTPELVDWLLKKEREILPEMLRGFASKIQTHRQDLKTLIDSINGQGKTIAGYGASTKGNVLLQYLGLEAKDIPVVAEVNAEKFGRVTPGTRIEICSEKDARARKPDYFLVLPWHFRDSIIKREEQFLDSGGRLIFPLPTVSIVSRK